MPELTYLSAISDGLREELEHETEWALAQPMPDPATAREGVFADAVTPLGDGRAPWSRWSGAGSRPAGVATGEGANGHA